MEDRLAAGGAHALYAGEVCIWHALHGATVSSEKDTDWAGIDIFRLDESARSSSVGDCSGRPARVRQ